MTKETLLFPQVENMKLIYQVIQLCQSAVICLLKWGLVAIK